MPVSEIRTGMTGVGRTVFEGSSFRSSRSTSGVLQNVQGPKRT